MSTLAGEARSQELRLFLRRRVEDTTASAAINPGHRIPFPWPPHPISADFHITPSEWRGEDEVEIDGERFPVRVARSPYGVFGRCEPLWCEARGSDEAEMRQELARTARPFLDRQRVIAETLGRPGRFEGHLRDLSEEELLMLLYCPDRNVGILAGEEIEVHATPRVFGPALTEVLGDRRSPLRRSAQWIVLDLFEALPSFFADSTGQSEAIEAIRELIWSAEDDYARTTFKAGVVLGGHVCTDEAAEALLGCLDSPSKIGRRSAIHGLFHLAEWRPELADRVHRALTDAAARESEPALRAFAEHMAHDIERGELDHVAEPLFADEPS